MTNDDDECYNQGQSLLMPFPSLDYFITTSSDEEEEEDAAANDNDECNPTTNSCCTNDENIVVSATTITNTTSFIMRQRRVQRPKRKQPPQQRRDWGIPSFHDQMDHGIKTFYMPCYYCSSSSSSSDVGGSKNDDGTSSNGCRCCCGGGDNNSNNNMNGGAVVVIHLEHRLHSTGSDLWDSALVLALSLAKILPFVFDHPEQLLFSSTVSSSQPPPPPPQNHPTSLSSVLELGSGTGAVGLYCAQGLGVHQVLLTDLSDNLVLIRKNCLANHIIMSDTLVDTIHNMEINSNAESQANVVEMKSSGSGDTEKASSSSSQQDAKVSVCELDWTNSILPTNVMSFLHQNHGVDLIVGSDLFLPFAPNLLIHLANRLAQIFSVCQSLQATSQPPPRKSSPVAILAYEDRFDCSIFFQHCIEHLNLSVQEIHPSWQHEKYQDPHRIHLLLITTLPTTTTTTTTKEIAS